VTKRSRALLAASTLLAALSAGKQAHAADADKGAAQVLFEQGRALIQDKRFAEACPKFAESLRLEPGIGTMLFLADCYENSGKTASAWAEFKDAAAAAALRHDSREQLAQKRADDLEPKLAKLVLVPPAEGSVPGIEVRRDGVVVGVAEYGIPVPVNPGVHELSASAPGKKPWTTSVSVVDKPGAISVVVPVLEALPEEPSPEPGTATSAVPGLAPRTWGSRQTIAVGAAGAGLVAIALGSYFGLHAKSTYDDGQKAGSLPEIGTAYSQATASTVLFCVGAAAIAGGAVLYFTAPRSSSPAVAVIPVASPWGGGVLLSRTF
jgi:hypothetical protein